MKHIPTLDYRNIAINEEQFIAELGAAYEEYGFCSIIGHGIPVDLQEKAYDAFKAFFSLPTETKMQYHLAGTGGRRGYTGFGIETAKDSKHPDLKEFWHVGPEVGSKPGFEKYRDVLPPNLWPTEVANFKQHSYALFEALDNLGTKILSVLAIYLELPREYFFDKTNFGTSILRPIHYPPISDTNTSSLRAAPHEDINLITLLVGSSADGLEVLAKDGEWVPIAPANDSIVINMGDMMQRLTNHRLPSTTHRVANPVGEKRKLPRYSVPYFLHPNADWLIETLPSCIDATHSNRYPEPITAHDYLMQRLREIRLM